MSSPATSGNKGFNVLHPQGYDSFGLPAEQYAIQTGQHPAVTTERNIARYREQLDLLGFSYDWSGRCAPAARILPVDAMDFRPSV